MGPDALKTGIQDGYVNPRYADAVKKRGHDLYKPDQNYKFIEKPIPAHLQNSADAAKYLRYTRPNTTTSFLRTANICTRMVSNRQCSKNG